jgi:hypothetical protein
MFRRTFHWSLSWAKWIQSTPSHLISLKIYSNIILLPMPRSSKWSDLLYCHQTYIILCQFTCHCFPWTGPTETPNVPCSKSDFHFLLPRSFQRIYPCSCVTFRNKLVFTARVASPLPNPQAGGPPLVSCLWMLIQYDHSYPLYLKAISSICNPRTCHARVREIHITRALHWAYQ